MARSLNKPEIRKRKIAASTNLGLFKLRKNDLPDRVSNPGLPRDRREYLPLYYRGMLVEC